MFLHCCLLESISSVETGEDLEELMEKEEHREQEEEEEKEDSKPVDLSEFQAFVLPVSCGPVEGLLYKNRFAGRWESELSLRWCLFCKAVPLGNGTRYNSAKSKCNNCNV